jgi:hypothetical protein
MKAELKLGGASVLVLMVASACSSGEAATGSQDSPIAIDKSFEDPAKILPPDFEGTLAAVISPADVGQTFGVDDDRIPYPDSYWPFRLPDWQPGTPPDPGPIIASNGIDDRWQGADITSPLERYMALTDPAKLGDAKSWEFSRHGEGRPRVSWWMGHCNGWTAAAMINPPLEHGVSVKRTSDGEIVECSGSGEPGCTTFEIGDINAVEAEVFGSAPTTLIGARCDTALEDIPRDEHGRILQRGCRGLNSGALVIVLANRMKNVKNAPSFVPKAIAINVQTEETTDQIWNQPAYRYQVNEARAISEAEAITMTTKLEPGAAPPTSYPWNPAAKGFFRVDIGIQWVEETERPNTKVVSGALHTQTSRFVAVLELDGEPGSPATRIIGGEYLDDPVAGANRITVAPFVWTANGVPSDSATRHNPFVKASVVQKLVAFATR